jgi:RNA polymerase-binding transcription factor DksA
MARVDRVEKPKEDLERFTQLLDDVEAAMERLDEGSYGSCERCGGLLEDARLESDPRVRYCALCERAPAPG